MSKIPLYSETRFGNKSQFVRKNLLWGLNLMQIQLNNTKQNWLLVFIIEYHLFTTQRQNEEKRKQEKHIFMIFVWLKKIILVRSHLADKGISKWSNEN